MFKEDESTWIRKLKSGDQKAFEVVFERYKDYLYRFIRKALPLEEDPEGIVQEVFISVWLNKENLDESKPIKPYLFTIAKNQIFDHLRKIYSKRKYMDSFLSRHASNGGVTADETEYHEFERFLSDRVDQLPEKRREIFKLSKLEGKSYREIAGMLHISENTVDMQMRWANKAIYRAIKQYLTYLIVIFPDVWQALD